MHVTTEQRPAALSHIRADVLDCVQSNLAVLADHFHGTGTHLRLGSKLSSRWYPGDDDLPTVDPPLAEGLDEAERALHLTVRGRESATGGELGAHIEPGGLRYAVADAYEMPWLPYHGRQRMAHSFLLIAPASADGAWSVADAYDNDTQWGPAKPGSWSLTAGELAGLSRVELFDIGPGPGTPPLPRHRIEHVPVDGYLAAFEAGRDRERVLHRMTGDIWLLARSRRLHALFTADGAPDEDTAHHLENWDKLATQVYVTYRRVARGRPEPAGTVARLAELLEADRKIFPAPDEAGGVSGEPEGLRQRVAAEVAAVLDTDASVLLGGDGDLTAIAGFTSFRMVDIIDRLEARLAVEFDSDALVPENLRSLDGLCRIVRGATGAR
ncbi:acyl carrier protein [Streptomyces chattanoogensis]|uniref:acyl carrier protein n=1 Tax=Streptomyces chattanoogensis TaxID=66876 RepID=UPI0036CC1D4A